MYLVSTAAGLTALVYDIVCTYKILRDLICKYRVNGYVNIM